MVDFPLALPRLLVGLLRIGLVQEDFVKGFRRYVVSKTVIQIVSIVVGIIENIPVSMDLFHDKARKVDEELGGGNPAEDVQVQMEGRTSSG